MSSNPSRSSSASAARSRPRSTSSASSRRTASSRAYRLRYSASGTATAAPAYSSSADRCSAGRSRRSCPDWPCSATLRPTTSPRTDRGTDRPPTAARDRPSAETRRFTSNTPSPSTSPSSTSAPASRARSATSPSTSTCSRASITARGLPLRTTPPSPRAPVSRFRLCTTIVLPAPVSPVTTVKPGDSSSTASSITPSALMRTSSIICSNIGPSAVRTRPPTPSFDREFEFGDESVRERLGVHPREAHRVGPAADLHPMPGRHLDRPSAVAGQHALLLAEDLERDHRVGADDERASEQRVGRQRDHQEGLHARPDHGTPGGEGVGGGAGRGGTDGAVAGPAGQRASLHLDDDLEQLARLTLLQRHLVQRPVGLDHLAAVPDGHVDGHPVLDRVGAGDHGLDGAVQVLRLGLGEEPDVPEVDAEQRDVRGPGERRATQQ